MSDLLSPKACESATLYASLVAVQARREIRVVLGVNGGRFFGVELYRSIYSGLVERCPDIPLGLEEVLDWVTRNQGGDLSNENRKEVLSVFADNSTSATGAYYAERVVTEGRKRLAAALGSKILQAENKTPSEILDLIERASRDLAPQKHTGPVAISEILGDVLAEIEAGPVDSVATGFKPLDQMLGGLAPGNLFVIGAGTGRGKTALAVNILVNAASDGAPVVFFALEMSRNEVGRRMLTVKGNVALRKDMSAVDKPDGLAAAFKAVETLPVEIHAGHAFGVIDIEAALEQMKVRNFQPKLIIVDYLQLMESRGPASNRQEQVAEVSRGLKRLAMRSETPIIVLSQLRRLTENESNDGRPGLHHLRESGAIEQDADAVLLLSNERVEHAFDNRTLIADLAKNRHGPVGDFKIQFNTQTQRMVVA